MGNWLKSSLLVAAGIAAGAIVANIPVSEAEEAVERPGRHRVSPFLPGAVASIYTEETSDADGGVIKGYRVRVSACVPSDIPHEKPDCEDTVFPLPAVHNSRMSVVIAYLFATAAKERGLLVDVEGLPVSP